MNYSTAVMLMNPNIRAVKVIYEDEKAQPNQQRYIFKTLDKDIKVDDFVVIPTDTRHKMTVVKVVEADVEIDFDASAEIKWIVNRVPTEAYAFVLGEEKKWIDTLKASEARKKREDIKKNIKDMYADTDIESLPFAKMSDAALTIEHKKETA